MDEIKKSIIEHQLAQRSNQLDLLQKGEYAVGTIRTWKDGKKYKKIKEGEWRLVVESAKVEKLPENTVDLSSVKAYSKQSKYWAKKKAEKEGLLVYEIGGSIYMLDPKKKSDVDIIAALSGLEPALTVSKKPKKATSSEKAWFHKFEKMSTGEMDALVEEGRYDEMSNAKFGALLLSEKFQVSLDLFHKERTESFESTKASQSLHKFIRSLNSYDAFDKENYKLAKPSSHYTNSELQDHSKLSPGERHSITAYTRDAYNLTNRFLSGKISFSKVPQARMLAKRYTEFLNESLAKVEEERNEDTDIAYRGYKPTDEEYQNKIMSYAMNIGGETTFGTMLSTSANPSGTLNEGGHRTIGYIIKRSNLSKGRFISAISGHGHEAEVLFGSDAKFKVLGVEINSSKKKDVEVKGESVQNMNTKTVVILEEL